jgi:hypothetical protein
MFKRKGKIKNWVDMEPQHKSLELQSSGWSSCTKLCSWGSTEQNSRNLKALDLKYKNIDLKHKRTNLKHNDKGRNSNVPYPSST